MYQRMNVWFLKLKSRSIYQYLLLAMITLFAAALRFYKLGEWSFWLDEIYSLNRAQSFLIRLPNLTETLIGLMLTYVEPSEWNARLIPALIGVVTIPILYFPIRKLFSPGVALVAALLLAVSPWHLYWSQNARSYSLLMLTYTLGLLLLFIGIEQDRLSYLMFSAFFLSVAVRERYLALFYVPIVLAYVGLVIILSLDRPPGFRIRNLLFPLLPVIVFVLTETPTFSGVGAAHPVEQVVGSTESKTDIFLSSFIGNPVANPLWLQAGLVYLIGLPIVCLGLFGGVYILLTERRRQYMFVFLGALIPFLSILVFSFFIFTHERYAFISLPFWIVLGALSVNALFFQTRGAAKLLAVGVVTLLLASSISQAGLYFKYQSGNRHDWKGAFAVVQSRWAEGDIVVSSYPEMGAYYLGQEVMYVDEINPDLITQSVQRVWYVEGVWGAFPDNWLKQNGELVDVRDVHLPLRTLTMRVYLYTPDGTQGTQVSR